MDNNEAVNIIVDVINKVKETDDYILKATDDLKLVLLNLKIQTAHIKGSEALEPIARYLEGTIEDINNQVKELVNANRKDLVEALAFIKNTEKQENICQ
jgi:hypothetical protein